MAGLGGNEIYKYPKNNPRDRVPIFLKKYNEKMKLSEEFELVNGSKVKFVIDKSVIDIVSKRQPTKGVILVDNKKKTWKFTDLKKNSEFGGSSGTGSGLGADLTNLTESSQAVYAAARWNRSKDFNETDLKKAYSYSDVSEPLDDIIKNLPGDWIASCKIGANKLYSEFSGKSYTFHRQSKWVEKLENHFKKLNKASNKHFSNVNKWSPADIYLVSSSGEKLEFAKTESIVELNSLMRKALDDRDIIGVSLKKIGGDSAKISYINVGERRKPVKYEGYTVAKKTFFSSKDININYSMEGEIQFRTFTFAPSSWQGEISGKYAKHGKVSYGVIYKFIESTASRRRLTNATLLKNNFAKGDEKTLKKFYEYYKKFDKKDMPKLKFEEFIQKYNEKGEEKVSWAYSKYLGCEVIDIIEDEKIEDKFVSKAVQYATSTSDLSGPFVKME